MELWDKEEFQPVKAILNRMTEDTVMSVRSVKILESTPDDSKTNLAIAQTQLNILNFMLNLPDVIKEANEQLGAQRAQVEKFKQSQRPDFDFEDNRTRRAERGN